MKEIMLASVMALGVTSASAIELGGGLSLGATTDLNYTTGTEVWELDVTPSLDLDIFGTKLSAETEIDILSLNDDNDIFTGVDWKAEYGWNGITAYTEVSSDADFEFGDITVGAKFSF